MFADRLFDSVCGGIPSTASAKAIQVHVCVCVCVYVYVCACVYGVLCVGDKFMSSIIL